jgi:hypothetical protein
MDELLPAVLVAAAAVVVLAAVVVATLRPARRLSRALGGIRREWRDGAETLRLLVNVRNRPDDGTETGRKPLARRTRRTSRAA